MNKLHLILGGIVVGILILTASILFNDWIEGVRIESYERGFKDAFSPLVERQGDFIVQQRLDGRTEIDLRVDLSD